MPSKFGIKSFCRNSGWLGWNSNGFWNLERVKQCAGFLPPCITTNSIWSSVLGLFDFIGFPNTLRQIQNRPQTFTTYKFLKITQAKIQMIPLITNSNFVLYKIPQMHHSFILKMCQPESMEKIYLWKNNKNQWNQ